MTTSKPPTETSTTWQQEQNSYLIALVLVVSTLAGTLYLLLQALQTGAWQFWVGTVIAALYTALVVVCTVYIRQGHVVSSIVAMFIVGPIGFLGLSLFMSGIGLPMSLGVFTLLMTASPLAVGGKWNLRLALYAVTISISILSLDTYLNIPFRTPAPAGMVFAFVIIILVMAIVNLFLLWRQSSSIPMSTKLVLPFIAVTITAAILVALVSINNTRNTLEKAANQTLRTAAGQAASTLDNFISSNLNTLSTEAQMPVFSAYLSLPEGVTDLQLQSQALQALNSLKNKESRGHYTGLAGKMVYGYITGYSLIDAQGRVVLDTTSSNIGQDMSKSPFFIQTMKQSFPYAAPVQFSSINQAHWYFGSRVYDASSSTAIGMLAVNFNGIAIQQLVSSMNNLAGTGSFAIVVDENNFCLADGTTAENVFKVIAAMDEGYIAELKTIGRLPNRNNAELIIQLPALQNGVALSEKQPNFQFATGEDGLQMMAASKKLESMPWTVVYTEPETEFMSMINDQVRNIQMTAMLVASLAAVLAISISHTLTRPITQLTYLAKQVINGNLNVKSDVDSLDEMGALARAFNTMTSQLRELIANLEQKVNERTQELAIRSTYLEAAGQVGKAAGSILDPQRLITQVVDLIQQQFGLYYVGLFLVDEGFEWAILRAGTGDAGKAMLARNHQLRLDDNSMIGWTITHGQARIALQAGEDPVRLATVELPLTRAEAALPLRSRGEVLGAVTVQSDRVGAFDPAAISVLQMMADQVAVALDNARLYTASQEALTQTRQAFGEVSREAWDQLAASRSEWGYRYGEENIDAIEGGWPPEMAEAAVCGEMVRSRNGLVLAVPIKIRNYTIGALSFRKKEGQKGWTPQEVTTLDKVIEQIGQAVESARLYQETQKRAQREQLTSEMTTRIRETLDVETVLKTAVREVQRALGLPEVVVRLGTPEQITPKSASNQVKGAPQAPANEHKSDNNGSSGNNGQAGYNGSK